MPVSVLSRSENFKASTYFVDVKLKPTEPAEPLSSSEISDRVPFGSSRARTGAKNRKTLLPEALEASQETPEKDAAEEWKPALVNVPCPLFAF